MGDLLKVSEAAQLLRIGRSKAYAMAASGELPVVRIGKLVRIPAARLDEWIDAKADTSQPKPAA